MPAVSPIEVGLRPKSDFRREILDAVNGPLMERELGMTVELSESFLLEKLGGSIEELRAEMEAACTVYRAVGWRVIYRSSGMVEGSGPCWHFNGRSF